MNRTLHVRRRWHIWETPRLTVGVILVLALALIAVFAVTVSPYSATAVDIGARLQAPSFAHWLGTDELGRDTLSRVILGTRVSLLVSVTAIGLGLAGGVILGSLAAYNRGVLELLITGSMDLLYAFPAILLAITVIAAFGVGLWVTAIAIGIVFVPYFARLARATALDVLQQTYIDVARTIGMSGRRLLLREVLPNIASPMATQAAVAMAYAIVTEAALSFLGLGAQPPAPSWGNMISDGTGFLTLAPWLSIAPGCAILIASFAFNLIGDGLRDRWDPRLRRQVQVLTP